MVLSNADAVEAAKAADDVIVWLVALCVCMHHHAHVLSQATTMIFALLDSNANVNCRDKYWRTPLHLWCALLRTQDTH